jgi:hypothetical protein
MVEYGCYFLNNPYYYRNIFKNGSGGFGSFGGFSGISKEPLEGNETPSKKHS